MGFFVIIQGIAEIEECRDMEPNNLTKENTINFNYESLAIEELKILSSIIGRIEGGIHQRQAWLVTILSGLTFALFKDSPYICKLQFAIFSVTIIIVFLIADAVQRVPVHRVLNDRKKLRFLCQRTNIKA